MSVVPFIEGFALSGGLIIAIGAQNAFVLTQSINANHAFLIAATCAVLDAALIFSGVFGLGALISQSPTWLWIATIGGALFLFIYGLLAFKKASDPGHLRIGKKSQFSVFSAISTTLGISLLNPHVYLDTVVLLGSVGGGYAGNGPWLFAIGATLASISWFMTLAYAGRVLAPYLTEDRHWKRLDIMVGVVMWMVAFSLLFRL